MYIIETRELTKSYGGFTAVSKVSLHIPKGSVYGFPGPGEQAGTYFTRLI